MTKRILHGSEDQRPRRRQVAPAASNDAAAPEPRTSGSAATAPRGNTPDPYRAGSERGTSRPTMRDRHDPAGALLRRGFDLVVKAGLRGVWLRGELPSGPFVWAANHHSWWDPFVAAVLLDRHGRTPCLIMLQANLARYRFIRRVGVFGTGEQRRGLEYLRSGRVLVIYPEGELRPPGRLGPLAAGAAWYADRARVPLYAVAVRVALRGHQAPEAYVSLAPVGWCGAVGETTGRLAVTLAAELADIDNLSLAADPRRPLPGFRRIVRGRHSWDERIDAMARWSPWPR